MVALTEQIVRGKTWLDKMDDVKNLNLWGQDLDDVSVVARLPNVEVLSLSVSSNMCALWIRSWFVYQAALTLNMCWQVNRISTLRDFRNCPKLTELYLRKNLIADISELSYLTGLRSLHTVSDVWRVLARLPATCAAHFQISRCRLSLSWTQ